MRRSIYPSSQTKQQGEGAKIGGDWIITVIDPHQPQCCERQHRGWELIMSRARCFRNAWKTVVLLHPDRVAMTGTAVTSGVSCLVHKFERLGGYVEAQIVQPGSDWATS